MVVATLTLWYYLGYMEHGIGELKCIVINTRNIEASVRFWSAVLGREVGKIYEPYVELLKEGHLKVSIQHIETGWAPGTNVHFDIKAEDIDESIKKVESLGGKLVEVHEKDRWRWATMQDPDGNLFCLV